MSAPLLEVRDLTVHLPTDAGLVRAVDGATFAVGRGETLGVAGESGAGKTVLFMAVMGLVDRRSARVGGRVLFDGVDLLALPAERLRRLRGERIGMVPQDPMTSLHPMRRVGDQIAETVLAHRDVPKATAAAMAVDALRRVGMPAPEQRARQWPHELSGGMRQRAMIAMAVVLEPDLLIADEPTTALDVTVQAQILELIGELRERLGIGVVLISHDLGVIADVAQRVMVMYAGRPVEIGPRDGVFHRPRHPYSWGLLESIPRPDARAGRLVPIAGAPPSPVVVPSGCPFHPRCPHRFAPCDRERPALAGDGHLDACHLPAEEKARLWGGRRARPAGAAA